MEQKTINIANKHGVLSEKDFGFDEAVLSAMKEYATLLTEEKDKRIREFKEWHDKRDRFNQITWIELDNKINELLTKHKQ